MLDEAESANLRHSSDCGGGYCLEPDHSPFRPNLLLHPSPLRNVRLHLSGVSGGSQGGGGVQQAGEGAGAGWDAGGGGGR